VQGEVVTFRALGPEGARLQAEWRNGQAAVAWAIAHEPLLAVAIVAHIRVGMPSGMRRELHAMLDATEAFVEDEALGAEDRAGWYLVSSHMNAGRMEKAAEHAERSFELYRAAGDPAATFRACIRRVINFSTFDPVRGAAALAELRALEHPSFEPLALAVAAEAAYLHEHFAGRAPEAMQEGSRAAERYRACGDAESARRIEANLVDTMLQAGRYEEAVALGEALVASMRGTRDLGPLTYAQLNLAAGLLALRRTADARAPLADAWPRAQLYGIDGECAAHLAWWCAQEGRFAAALQLAGFSEGRYAAASQAADGLARGSLREAEAAAAKRLDASAIAAGKAAGVRLRADDVGALAFGSP
jgi:tetratricopeptide (TPR) repeat protein